MQRKLCEMTRRFPVTKLWCDSADDDDIAYAAANGAVGITTNPPIIASLLSANAEKYAGLVRALGREHRDWDDERLLLELMKAICREKSDRWFAALRDESAGRLGRFTLQTSPELYRQADRMVGQAVALGGAFPCMQVKLPACSAGFEAIEACTARGLSVTATLGFTVSGILRSAEAVERGLGRRAGAGGDVSGITPYVAAFVGRLDNYIQRCAAARGIALPEPYFDFAGVAVAKKAYRLLRDRGLRTKLMLGAFRKTVHWSEFLGGDLSMTISRANQELYDRSDVPIEPTIDRPVDADVLDGLMKVPEFAEAYAEDRPPEAAEAFGGFRETREAFAARYAECVSFVSGAR